MSLGKATTRIKEGVQQVKTVGGIKKLAVEFGMGMALGVLVDLILWYLFVKWIYPATPDWSTPPTNTIRIEGFSPYPNGLYVNAAGANVYYTNVDDAILIVISILMLFSKKFWVVIGFVVGWWSSSYFNLSNVLIPATVPSYIPPTP